MCGCAGGRMWTCDDVDGTEKGRCSVDSSGRPFQHFYAFDFANVDWEIEGIVSGLRVANVDAVE